MFATAVECTSTWTRDQIARIVRVVSDRGEIDPAAPEVHGGAFIESWAHPGSRPDPAAPPPRRRVPPGVWRVVSVGVFLAFLAAAVFVPFRGVGLCRHPGINSSLPMRIIVALIGLGIARAIWILGVSTGGDWRYAGPDGVPHPVRRLRSKRTGAWWALLPWFIFLGFIAALFLFHLGDCG